MTSTGVGGLRNEAEAVLSAGLRKAAERVKMAKVAAGFEHRVLSLEWRGFPW